MHKYPKVQRCLRFQQYLNIKNSSLKRPLSLSGINTLKIKKLCGLNYATDKKYQDTQLLRWKIMQGIP